jgi:hypothetical protein
MYKNREKRKYIMQTEWREESKNTKRRVKGRKGKE